MKTMAGIVAVCASFGSTGLGAKPETKSLMTRLIGHDHFRYVSSRVYKDTIKFVYLGVTVCENADPTCENAGECCWPTSVSD